MTQLVWFRTDLRLEDQPAIMAARSSGPALGLYIVSTQQWHAHDDAPVKIDFWRRALIDLQPRLAQCGVALKLLRVDNWKDVPQALLEFCVSMGVDVVHCNREQGLHERARDREAFALLKANDIQMIGHDGQTLFAPGSLKTGAGDTYRVFSPFARACRTKLRATAALPLPAPTPLELPSGMQPDSIEKVWPDSLPSLNELWPADHAAVNQRLTDFVASAIDAYDTARDFPAQPGTSRLSPYLAAGLISTRQCLHAARQANGGEIETGIPGVGVWINELLWREFYWHLLHGYPKLSKHKPLRDQTEAVRWRDAPEDYRAWCDAKTGIPIVDAAMRQICQTGWMHNRLRMIVAMFFSKNLLLDWRHGEKFFMQHLIDGELAANNGGWQWSASTGADSAPYFRVFNPVSQSQKFDPRGDFIRHWVPELSRLDGKNIHDPTPEQRRACAYPLAIVELKSSRLRAIEAFKRLAITEE